jgi:dihydroorotase
LRLVELFTTGPASVVGLRSGRLAPGETADVTIFDANFEWTYDVTQSFSKSRNTPFHGRRFRGAPMATIVDGKVVWSRAPLLQAAGGVERRQPALMSGAAEAAR